MDVHLARKGRVGTCVIHAGTLLAIPGQPPARRQTILVRDGHVHLTTEAAEGEAARVVTRDAADLALTARMHARETLDAGFTTVLDLGTARAAHNEAIHALRRAVDLGIAIGPADTPGR